MNERYRRLPSVDRLLADPLLAAAGTLSLRTAAVREALDEVRRALGDGGEAPDPDAIAARARAILDAMQAPSLRPVINATGVILHTNLGRAPLADDALAAMVDAGRGYTNLEYELDAGGRGSRFSHLDVLLRQVTGAEAGIAVNNNASAILLMLSALCREREVIVSRGQAVEIGGGFRIPDVLRQSGATLVEVGTTNRTSLADFADAIGERTAAILRVHASNFRVVGFTTFPTIRALAGLARERGVLLLDDLGSGCLLDTTHFGMLPEPTVQESVQAGADIAAFSGDKLLGGPQAGILVGRAGAIAQLRRHPLARAVRMDKTSIAALAATLRHYARGDALESIPIWRMLSTSMDEVARRAEAWAAATPVPAAVVAGKTMVGGGSLPEEGVETRLLSVTVANPSGTAAQLRRLDPPLIVRIGDERLLLDPRTVLPEQDGLVAAALSRLSHT